MTGSSKLRRHFLLLAALLLVLGVSLHFCLWKSGMFIDEIYTYGLANSHDMPFIGHGEDDRLAEQLLTREDFFDYLAVTDAEPRFDAVSVYENQVRDVHPPLYYWLINFSSSLAEGSFSKWIGLVPNLVVYLGMLLLLYLLVFELFGSPAIAALTVMLYGLSHAGLSTLLMIRMYVLMSFWTVLLALLVTKELRAPCLKLECAIGLTVFAGLMTQYYFVFYAFFLCLVVGICLLTRREIRAALRFALCAFAGVGAMLLCFPAALGHLTTGGNDVVSGSHALSQFLQFGEWFGRLRYYFGQIRVGLPVAVAVSVLALLFCIVSRFASRHTGASSPSAVHPKGGTSAGIVTLLLLLPVIPTVFVAAILSPVVEGRYIYNVMPICTLFPAFCLYLLRLTKNALRAAVPLVTLLALFVSLNTVPDYIYSEHRSFNQLADQHSTDPCVYLTGYYAGVTQDMLQLMRYDDVYVTEDPGSPGLLDYLERSDCGECIVYIDVDGYWGSGFCAEETLGLLLDETDYTEYEPLYAYALSDTYLLRK